MSKQRTRFRASLRDEKLASLVQAARRTPTRDAAHIVRDVRQPGDIDPAAAGQRRVMLHADVNGNDASTTGAVIQEPARDGDVTPVDRADVLAAIRREMLSRPDNGIPPVVDQATVAARWAEAMQRAEVVDAADDVPPEA